VVRHIMSYLRFRYYTCLFCPRWRRMDLLEKKRDYQCECYWDWPRHQPNEQYVDGRLHINWDNWEFPEEETTRTITTKAAGAA